MKLRSLQITSSLEKFLFRRGYFVERASSRIDVLDTVALLRAVPCSKSLIRLGRGGDGGYVLPDDFVGVGALFSPGVGFEWTFEEDFASLTRKPIFMCDPSPVSEDCPFEVSQFLLGPSTHGSYISLEDWIQRSGVDDNQDLIMQMDIEGAEYAALQSCSDETLKRFRILVIEFHFLDRMLNGLMLELMYKPVLTRLHELFDVVNLHPNNAGRLDVRSGIGIPQALEVTYLRKDRNAGPGPQFFPDVQSHPNLPDRDEIALTFEWYSAN